MTQAGADTVITFDANNSITLSNVQMANLHAGRSCSYEPRKFLRAIQRARLAAPCARLRRHASVAASADKRAQEPPHARPSRILERGRCTLPRSRDARRCAILSRQADPADRAVGAGVPTDIPAHLALADPARELGQPDDRERTVPVRAARSARAQSWVRRTRRLHAAGRQHERARRDPGPCRPAPATIRRRPSHRSRRFPRATKLSSRILRRRGKA